MIISELKDQINASKITNYLGISRSSFHYKKRANITTSRISKELEEQIIDLSKERVTYGYRRIWALLRNSGIRINAKTVYRVMKNYALKLNKYEYKKRKSREELTKPKEPDKSWEMDITYISTKREMVCYIYSM
ncbi:MAG: IS3 family transposase [Candidatus Micrarchaeaceae archaeon]